jgi:hypothetical protein
VIGYGLVREAAKEIRLNQNYEDSFLGILLGDVSKAMERQRLADGQAERRDTVRTSFAAIEGLAWMFRERVISVAESTYGLEPEERQALAEIAYSVDQQGHITTQSRFIPFLAGIRLSARICARLSPELEIDFAGIAWQRFKGAVAIRNRITHPKSIDDMLLSDIEVNNCVSVLFWFLEVSTAVGEATNRALNVYLGELDEVMRLLRSGDPATIALYERLLQARADDPG